MMRRITRGALIGGVLAALAATTVAVTSAGATEPPGTTADPNGFQQRFDAGELRLVNTGPSTVEIQHWSADDQKLATQRLTASSRCLVTSSGPQLMTVVAAGARSEVGLVSNGLGVRSKNNCSTDSGRIGQGQSLTVALGETLTDAEITIDAAELDIEAKFEATLSYSLDGGDEQTVPLSADTGDSGPDAGPGDNYRVPIGMLNDEATFTSIRLAPLANGSGEIALEGGGDFGLPADPTRVTIFHLVALSEEFEYAFDCGDVIAEETDRRS
jgi:hypothetical protein